MNDVDLCWFLVVYILVKDVYAVLNYALRGIR